MVAVLAEKLMVNISKNLSSVLILSIIFIVSSYLLKDMQWYSSLFQILASTALTVWVTLAVVEVSLRKEKERQWKTTRIFTYKTILEMFRDIFRDSSLCAFFVTENDDNELSQLREEISANRSNVAVAMVKYAILLKKGYLEGDKERYKRDSSEYIKVFKKADKDMQKHFNLITFSLIPRIQQFSEDDHINKQMLILEIYYRRFKEIADWQDESGPDFIYHMIVPYVNLLKIVGLLYDSIQMELQQEL